MPRKKGGGWVLGPEESGAVLGHGDTSKNWEQKRTGREKHIT